MRRGSIIGAGAVLAAGSLALVAGPISGAPAETSQAVRPTAATSFATHPLQYDGELAAYKNWLKGTAFWNGVVAAAEQATRPRSQGGGGCAPGDWECAQRCIRKRESDRGDKGGQGNYDQGYGASNGQYRGAYQFDQSTWDSNAAASGRPDLVGQDPAGAAPSDQDAVAHTTYQSRGTQPWGGSC